jgi:hypothetical protein
MPVAKHPFRREFYVYSLAAYGKSFYVGIGHVSRASKRVAFVEYLMRVEKRGRPVKWVTSNRVVAHLLRAGIDVKVKYLRSGLTRPRALKEEREIIERFHKRGVVLANQHHNGGSRVSVGSVLANLKRRAGARVPL